VNNDEEDLLKISATLNKDLKYEVKDESLEQTIEHKNKITEYRMEFYLIIFFILLMTIYLLRDVFKIW